MNSKLLRNIVSLFGIQGMNYIIPLITLPYLVKTLGPESYGVLGFSLAFIQYFCLITDYGFNLSASRKVAMHASEHDEISEIFWHVTVCKITLAFFGFIITYIACFAIPFIRDQENVILASYGLVIGNILFPVWLFQGKEQMGLSSIANIVSRTLSVPLIFILVKDGQDATLAALITSATAIVGGLISVIILCNKQWISVKKIKLSRLISEYKDGWHVFLSTAAISLYTTSITVILGFVAGPVAVGYFVAADKLRQAVQGLLGPVSQAVYPRVNNLMSIEPEQAFKLLRKLFKGFSVAGLILSISIFIFASIAVNLLYGPQYNSSIIVLYIIALCPLLVAISNVLGVQTMLVLGYTKEFSQILIVSGLLCLSILFPLSYFFSEAGAAWAVLITELSVTLMMFFFIKKKKILLF